MHKPGVRGAMDNAPLVSIRTRHVSRAWSVTGLGVSTPSPNVATQTQIVTEPRADVALLQLITVLVQLLRWGVDLAFMLTAVAPVARC